MITDQEYVRKLYIYDPDTGNLRWRDGGKGKRQGDIVGSLDTHGHVQTNHKGKGYKVHRIIWLYVHGEWPVEIDHINGVRDDNRISNLRNVGIGENNRNAKLDKNNKTGISGVRFATNEGGGYWVSISINRKHKGEAQTHLGTFHDFFEACCARKSAENRYGYHPNHGRTS